MTNKVNHRQAHSAHDIETLYLDLLHSFYEEEDHERSRDVAERLEAALAERPNFAGSIRGEEVRSLIAELRGDLAEAVRHRESEIEKIRQLHGLVEDNPGRDYVFRQYDYSDLSDRLDILATLYAEQGDLERAVEILQESQRFCESTRFRLTGRTFWTSMSKTGGRGKVPKETADGPNHRNHRCGSDRRLCDDPCGADCSQSVPAEPKNYEFPKARYAINIRPPSRRDQLLVPVPAVHERGIPDPFHERLRSPGPLGRTGRSSPMTWAAAGISSTIGARVSWN